MYGIGLILPESIYLDRRDYNNRRDITGEDGGTGGLAFDVAKRICATGSLPGSRKRPGKSKSKSKINSLKEGDVKIEVAPPQSPDSVLPSTPRHARSFDRDIKQRYFTYQPIVGKGIHFDIKLKEKVSETRTVRTNPNPDSCVAAADAHCARPLRFSPPTTPPHPPTHPHGKAS